MKLKCIVVDDEPYCAVLIEKYITATNDLEHIRSFSESKAARDFILEGNEVDICFLDIEMPVMSGLELAGEIKSKSLIVFTTGHRDFGADAYRHNAVDYLLKPVRYEHFQEAVHKAVKLLEQSTPGFFYARESLGGKLVKIIVQEVIYVKCQGNYAKLFFTKEKFHLIHISSTKLMSILPRGKFLRVHKSFIVNLDHFQSLEGNMLGLKDGCVVPIGPSFRDDLLDRIDAHIL